MKYLTKLLALLFSVIFLLQGGTVTAETADEVVAPIESAPVKQHENAVNVLNALGILTEEEAVDFQETNHITRAEFIYYTLRLLGVQYEPSVSKDDVRYRDIPYSYWATPYIIYASNLELISGHENGEFCPEDWITYEQAVKILLSAIGHTERNSRINSYPTGYITLATKLGLLKNVAGNVGHPITKGDVAEMLFNALEVEAVQQISLGDKESYSKDGTLMMECYLQVRKVNGVWNGTETKNAYGANFPQEGIIEIDRTPYYLGDCQPDDSLLFKNVVAYVRMDEDEDEPSTLLFLAQGRGNYLEISPDELIGVPDVSSLKFNRNNKTSTARFAESLTILLNGRYYKPKASITADDLCQPQTTLMLYDNNNDGKYELLQLKRLEIVVIDKVSPNYGFIFFKYGTTLGGSDNIDASNSKANSIVYIYNQEGERVDPLSLKQWDVLEVYRTVDSSFTEIYISNERIRGTVENISDDEVIIDSKIYHLSHQYLEAVESGNENALAVRAGVEYTFYMSASGRIAAISTGASAEYLYAYMIAFSGDPGDLSPNAQVKLFSQTGEMLVLDVASKITLDGKRCSGHKEFLETMLANSYNRECVVKYGLNAEGKLNYLDTPERTAQDASNPNSVRFEMAYDGDMNWTAGYELDGTLMRMTSQTVVFSIPKDLSKDKDFRSIQNSQLPIDSDHDVPAKFDLYDANDVYRVGAAVYYADGVTDESRYTGTLVVERLVQVLDDEEETRTKLYARQAISLSAGSGYSVPATFLESEPGIFDGVVPGSVIQYKVNNKNEIGAIRHDFKPDPNLTYYGNSDKSIQFGDQYYGEIVKISQADKMILIDAGAAGYISFLNRGIVRYEAKRNRLTAIAFEDMRVGDKVYLVGNNSHPMITVIYNYD